MIESQSYSEIFVIVTESSFIYNNGRKKLQAKTNKLSIRLCNAKPSIVSGTRSFLRQSPLEFTATKKKEKKRERTYLIQVFFFSSCIINTNI